MALAIFDLDDTLIHGDSASLFLQFLVQEGIASADLLEQEAGLMQAYHQGNMLMEDYMALTLEVLRGYSTAEVDSWVAAFIERTIAPRVYVAAREALKKHRQAGDRVLIISATGEHIVGPIARFLGVDDFLAINLVAREGHYTGQTRGVLTYQQGKVQRLLGWLQEQNENLHASSGYSDSANDVPLLSVVNLAYAVNPDTRLAKIAAQQGWPCLSW
jgi:HAD superfamily hydrolase (TIGR01490 family)